jgi:two-component system response regulator PhoP
MMLNVNRRELECGELVVGLTQKESLLADILLRHIGLPVSKDALCEHIYAHPAILQGRRLDMLVGRLRKKLALAGNRCRVQSVRNLGYKLVMKLDG